MVDDTTTSWERAATQLREAAAALAKLGTAAQRWLVTRPRCCQARIGLTPGGTPINWHTPDCPELTRRLAAFDADTCPAATRGLPVGADPGPVLLCSLDVDHAPPHRTSSGAAFQEWDR